MSKKPFKNKALWESEPLDGGEHPVTGGVPEVVPVEISPQGGGQEAGEPFPAGWEPDDGPAAKPAYQEPNVKDEELADAVAHNPHLIALTGVKLKGLGPTALTATMKRVDAGTPPPKPLDPAAEEKRIRKQYNDSVDKLRSLDDGIRHVEHSIEVCAGVVKSFASKIADDRAAIPPEPKPLDLDELLQVEALGGEGAAEATAAIKKARREFNVTKRLCEQKRAQVEADVLPTEQSKRAMERLLAKHERERDSLKEEWKKARIALLIAKVEIKGHEYAQLAKELERKAMEAAVAGDYLKRLKHPNSYGGATDELHVPSLFTESTKIPIAIPLGYPPPSLVGLRYNEERAEKYDAAEKALLAELAGENLKLDLPDAPPPQPTMTQEEREADRLRRYELEWPGERASKGFISRPKPQPPTHAIMDEGQLKEFEVGGGR